MSGTLQYSLPYPVHTDKLICNKMCRCLTLFMISASQNTVLVGSGRVERQMIARWPVYSPELFQDFYLLTVRDAVRFKSVFAVFKFICGQKRSFIFVGRWVLASTLLAFVDSHHRPCNHRRHVLMMIQHPYQIFLIFFNSVKSKCRNTNDFSGRSIKMTLLNTWKQVSWDRPDTQPDPFPSDF